MRPIRPMLASIAAAAFGALLACSPAQKGDSPMNVKPNANGRSDSGYDVTPLAPAVVKELASKLSPESYRVTQNAGTEPAFCGNLLDNKKEGTYTCIVCGLPLFSSEHKFNSGTGWPSFHSPVDKAHIANHDDRSYGMVRTEIDCARCGAHLGHVFEDGPKPTGLRYCLNSASLTFVDKGKLPAAALTKDPTGLARGEAALAADAAKPGAAKAGDSAAPAAAKPTDPAQPKAAPSPLQSAYFAGGCFWGIEHWFELCPGVVSAESGYMGGSTDKPTYKQVCNGDTGHAEVVKVVFDPSKVTYHQLCEGFFIMHDPTQLNRQGPDVGDQYRSAIFCPTPEQAAIARSVIADLTKAGAYGGKKIVTQVVEGGTYFPAEDYHQDYITKTGRYCHGSNPWPQVLGTGNGAAESGQKH